jgi:hypothetical protein
MCKSKDGHIDVLIVCGQGVYIDGKYYSEYPDHNVYLEHAMTVKDIFDKFNYTHIVCSGSYTQNNSTDTGVKNISEAQSFINMWEDTDSYPNCRNITLDEYSLDSIENVILGLISLRHQLNKQNFYPVIRRVGVYSTWQFKKKRFNILAKELGIINQFYFHGFVDADKAEAGELALNGEKKFLIENKNDPFLVSSNAENRKRARLKKGDYDTRLDKLKKEFSNLFNDFKCEDKSHFIIRFKNEIIG